MRYIKLELIISIVALLFSSASIFKLGMLPESLVVSILCTLVTILIAWQIYNAIEVNRKLQTIGNEAKRAAESVINKYDHTIKAYHIFYDGVILYIAIRDNSNFSNDTELVVHKMFKCLDEALKGLKTDPIEYAIEILTEISNKNSDKNIFIYKGYKTKYLKTLAALGILKDNNTIYNMIINAIEKNEYEK